MHSGSPIRSTRGSSAGCTLRTSLGGSSGSPACCFGAFLALLRCSLCELTGFFRAAASRSACCRSLLLTAPPSTHGKSRCEFGFAPNEHGGVLSTNPNHPLAFHCRLTVANIVFSNGHVVVRPYRNRMDNSAEVRLAVATSHAFAVSDVLCARAHADAFAGGACAADRDAGQL